VPRIVELQESQPTAFVARATMWIDLVEQALVAARAYEAARLATLKSQLLFARSFVAHEPPESRTQPTRARQLAFDAANAMTEAAAVATAVLDEHRPRFADADRRVHAIVAKLRSRNLVPPPSVMPSTREIADARRAVGGRRDLEREYLVVEACIGADDAGLLLGRALAREASAGIANGGQEGTNHTRDHR
jgi:hypothetical protein